MTAFTFGLLIGILFAMTGVVIFIFEGAAG